MRFTSTAAGVLATAALLAVPAAANAATGSAPSRASATPCAAPGGFAQVAPGQSLAQVQQEMGSTGNTSDTTTQGQFTREEVTWRNCANAIGRAGIVTYGVTFNASPGHPLTESSKTQFALLG